MFAMRMISLLLFFEEKDAKGHQHDDACCDRDERRPKLGEAKRFGKGTPRDGKEIRSRENSADAGSHPF
jgi:hypothetical protein